MWRFVWLSLFCIIAPIGAASRDFSLYSFDQFVRDFNKSYSEIEYTKRELIFNASLEKIKRHNAAYLNGYVSWWLDANHLADWTTEELRGLCATHRTAFGSQAAATISKFVTNPARVDWRDHAVVTKVKDQGHCGSCWAFAAAETIESHLAIASGKLLELAPQAFVNCVENPQRCGGSGGCGGATMELAYNLSRHFGLPLEVDMPYVRHAEVCEPYSAAVHIGGYVKLPANDATALENTLANVGPVSVLVAGMPWQLYSGGIFAGCSQPLPSIGNELDHGVQVVGYGSEKGQGYWLVRNSWGPSWGEGGYIRISRRTDQKTFIDDDPGEGSACKPYPKTQTVGGECGILFDASYPTLVHTVSDYGVVI